MRRFPFALLAALPAQSLKPRSGGHRIAPKLPQRFVEELECALQLIALQPGIGARAQNAKLEGVRRIHLTRVRYYLYYRLAQSPPVIEVLALWHTSRGSDPPM